MSEKQSCVEVVRFIGVDVSKEKLDVCVMPGGELHDFQNDAEGIEKLVALFKQLRPVAIVLEATGGYERPPLFAMQDAGLPVTLVNPRQVRDFARGLGQLAKTDRLDAAVLAEFARLVAPAPSEKTSEKQRELEALVVRRRQLVTLLVAEENRATRPRTNSSCRPSGIPPRPSVGKFGRSRIASPSSWKATTNGRPSSTSS